MDLHGVRILVTRPREQAGGMARLIEAAGAIALCVPMIRILPPERWEECDRAIEHLHSYTGVVFTSVNAVEQFLHRMAEKNTPTSRLASKTVYAVGEKTARVLQRSGVQPAPLPSAFSGKDLAEHMRRIGVWGGAFLLPRGSLGRDDVATGLRELGATTDSVVVYRTTGPDASAAAFVRTAIASGSIDVATFASPSAVEHFVGVLDATLLETARHHLVVAAIGETTADAVRKAGFREPVVARTATTEGLMEALLSSDRTS
jgi:uroporphyrinogen-III synthase